MQSYIREGKTPVVKCGIGQVAEHQLVLGGVSTAGEVAGAQVCSER
jgi:hypothetical protein